MEMSGIKAIEQDCAAYALRLESDEDFFPEDELEESTGRKGPARSISVEQWIYYTEQIELDDTDKIIEAVETFRTFFVNLPIVWGTW